MIGAKVSITQQLVRLLSAKAADATYRNLGHAAASLRKEAVGSVKVSRQIIGYRRFKTKSGASKTIKIYKPSPKGTPVFTRRGLMKRAIRFDVSKNRKSAVIGPQKSVLGIAGSVHEFGKHHLGTNYPERPTMTPALIKSTDRMAADWAGSIRS